MKNKELMIRKIENGYVVDHVPSGLCYTISRVLNLENSGCELYMGRNVSSGSTGKKDFLKVVGIELTEDDLNKIALVAPHVTVNKIKDFEVVKKVQIEPPKIIENVLKCPNVNCITNHSAHNNTRFNKTGDSPLIFKCFYCERPFEIKDMDFL
jgi:aspartate carbamoyltransferase regulatory subunit